MTDMLKLLKIVDKVEKPVMINEAVSLNISANGDCPCDITAMLGKLVNLANPEQVTDKMMPQGNTHDTMVKTIANVGNYADQAAQSYADEVGEEWANEPEPEVSDVEYITKDLAGGINKPKAQFKKEYPGDNPMTIEGSLANKLMVEYKNLIENDSKDKDKEGKVVYCSQCAKGFRLTPNTAKTYHTGFSHCKDHKGLKVAVSEASADTLNRYREKAVSSDTSNMNPNKAFARKIKYPALASAKIAAGKDDEDSKYALNRYKMSGGKVNVPAKEDQVNEITHGQTGTYSGTPKEKIVNFRGTISQTNKKIQEYRARGYVITKHTTDNGKHNYTMTWQGKTDEGKLNELSPKTLASYAKQASGSSHPNSAPNLASRAGFELGQSPDDDYTAGEKHDMKSVRRSKFIGKAIDRLTK